MRIEGARAIVTGASSGIGRATARALALAGAHVVLASRQREALEELAQELAEAPGRCLVVPTDVRERESVQAMTKETLEALGGIDILINNAGLGLDATVAEGDVDNMRYVLDVNLLGAIHCIQAVVPHMRAQGRGVIVNVSSVAARVAMPYGAIYSATKAALAALSSALRVELAPYGIKVVAVFPGYTVTPFHRHSIKEVELPTPSPLLRAATAEAVARRILRAIRREERWAYVSWADRMAVLAADLAPGLVEWGLKTLWLRSRTPRPLGDRRM
jgi:short-subunit dehydrogenase